jgi:DnaJ-class molecular chaperone
MPRLECPNCLGKGYKIEKKISADGIFHREKCPTCKGSGLLPSVFTR